MAVRVRSHPIPERDCPFVAESLDDDGRRLLDVAQGQVQCIDYC
jgi:hypothetical protein